MSFEKRDSYTADIVLRRLRPLQLPVASTSVNDIGKARSASDAPSNRIAAGERRRRRGRKQRETLIYAVAAIGWGGISFCWKTVVADDGAQLVVKFAREGMQAEIQREAAVYDHLRRVSCEAEGSSAMSVAWPQCYGLFAGSGFTALVIDFVGEPLYDWGMLQEGEK
jgi:hypothetical protein